jgi:hypothetical protein
MQSNIATKHNQLYVGTLIIFYGSDNTWYVDIDATNHMTHDIESFVSYNKWEKGQFFYLGDNSTHEIIKQGEVSIKLNDGTIKEVINVLHVSGIQKNLFSTKQFDHDSGEILIKFCNCFLKNSHGQQIAKCILEADLYKLGVTNKQENKIQTKLNLTHLNITYLWHMNLGHINKHKLLKIQFMSKGLGSFDEKMLLICPSCIKGKQHHNKFPKEGACRVQDILKLVHSDVCGPLRTPTFSGCTYFITFIDGRFRYTKIYLLKSKAEVFSKF